MAYTINITATNAVVVASSTSTNVAVTAENNLFTVTNVYQILTATSYLNTITVYENAVELVVDDFANYFKGDWVSNNPYRRGLLVDYAHSLYVCSTSTGTTVVSSVNPATDQVNWTRVVWHEAPFDHLTVTNKTDLLGDVSIGGNLQLARAIDHFTVTNLLQAGSIEVTGGALGVNGTGLTVNTTATFNGKTNLDGNIDVNGDITFYGLVDLINANIRVNNLTVTNQLTVCD